MKLWTILFADPAFSYQSARIAAPARYEALMLMAAELGTSFNLDPKSKPARNVIIQYAGDIAVPCPQIVRIVERGGGILEAR